ncbi:kinetochore protein Nuf2-like, partial [Cryptotermes secundus]
MMLKEVRDLKPNYDVESLRKCQLTELLKILLAFVMEKEAEMFHMLQKQMNEIHTQTSESEKEYDDKDRHKDCCVRELEAEVKKSEVVTEPAENLVLKKQLEEGLEKQRELAKENENLAIHITGLREEVNKLVTEITNLTKSINILVAEKHGINVPVCIEDCEIEDLKRQQDRCLHEKTTLVADCKCMQEQQDVICSEHEHRSPIIKKESCLESLHSGSQLLSVGVADSMTQDCRMEVSEEENLKEQLEICMEQKIALDDENEQLVTRIRGLENMLGIYCMDNDSLQKSNEALEEDMKKL